MDDEAANNRKSKRGRRRTTAGLRKHQQIDGVVVEELFPLFRDSSSTEKVGDGIYVSATVAGTKRFYGVMVDQSSLKEASTLFFQDQSDSLRLNERMKTLNSRQQQHLLEHGSSVTRSSVDSIAATTTVGNEGDNNEEVEGAKPSIGTASNDSTLSTPERNNQMNGNAGNANEANHKKIPVSPPLKKARLSLFNPSDDKTGDTHRHANNAVGSSETDSKINNRDAAASTSEESTDPTDAFLAEERPVQKFKYFEERYKNGGDGGRDRKGKESSTQNSDNSNSRNIADNYRILVATFSSVFEAACGDRKKAQAIHEACEQGGNFLSGHYENDSYYYQYEVLPSSLAMDVDSASKLAMIRTSMGFHSFLHSTALPPWYPLSNLYSQTKALNLLNMKQGDSGKIKREGGRIKSDGNKNTHFRSSNDVANIGGGTRLPMQARAKKQYQIGVVGGGIAGLACCQELVRVLNNDGINAKVTLVEARSRLGGRIATDRTWKTTKNYVFPVELGASWIHGIDDNPLATLAQGAGIEFVRASEEVKMVDKHLKEVDSKMDEKMGKLFDDLLDHAAEDCWTTNINEESTSSNVEKLNDSQSAVRWYASCFAKDDADKKKMNTASISNSKDYETSNAIRTPAHRQSSDRSVDCEIGKAIAKYRLRDFSKLTSEEHRMLLWNSKNVEYALGSNLNNLSMRYWDVDDRHAFEGDHVLLKEGYSAVIEHMLKSLNALGPEKFECLLSFPVGKVEYGRKSEMESYGRDRFGRERHLTELSDTCSITSEDGNHTKFFDFLVSAVPLGVLKESVDREKDVNFKEKMTFVPSLPFSKIDAIRNVGFGLLNKVYIQFKEAFWRIPGFFKDDDDCLFGNVTGVNPHHYMFFDIGKRLGSEDDSPAILMSLVSGKEAVALEYLSDEEVIQEVVETLQVMFPTSITIPDPIGFRITRWGKDRFSRGSYTYLPPGSTDQDFHMLQSPVNVSGDSLLIENSAEVMRLFFAGEHTTALHPSVAHGAMLSGMRAAQQVVSTIQSKNKEDKDIDKSVPISIFKYWNPKASLQCNLCHKVGGGMREGPMLAFKRGARQVLVHNNCAEFCPEVEVVDFKWKNVIRAVNRGKALTCCHCSQNGATIGCSGSNCYRMFHFSCAEDTGWRFDRDGKVFFCDKCRVRPLSFATKRCDRISTKYYMMKNQGQPLVCHLCRMPENAIHGELLAFQRGERQMCCVHLNCVKYTSIVDTFEAENSRMSHEYLNVFEVLEQSRVCSTCNNVGASICCSSENCDRVFHYHCAMDKSGRDFERKGGKKFYCEDHRKNGKKKITPIRIEPEEETGQKEGSSGGLNFQHNLFATFGGTTRPRSEIKIHIPGNLDISDAVHSPRHKYFRQSIEGSNSTFIDKSDGNESSEDDDDSFFLQEQDGQSLEVMDLPLSRDISGPRTLVRLKRSSTDDFWNISLQVLKIGESVVVTVAPGGIVGKDKAATGNLVSLQVKDIIASINGSKVGSDGIETLRCILFRLKEEVDLMLEVIRT